MYVDFEYANRRLSDFGCIMCHIDTESGNREIDIGCDITFNTVKNNQTSLHNVTSSTYENVFTTTFEIIKNICGKEQDEIYMTLNEVRQLVKWLNRRGYHKFKLYNQNSEADQYVYFGSFNVKQKMLGDNILGLSLTFTANSPYALGEMLSVQYDVIGENEIISFLGDSDEYGCVYPTVTIAFTNDYSDFSITNNTTGTELCLQNCSAGEVIVLDGANKVITTDNENHSTLYNDFNYEYLDILIDEDDFSENEYIVSNPCTITLEYYPVRKVGVC